MGLRYFGCLLFVFTFLFCDSSYCFLTSDFNINYGITNYRIVAGQDSLNLTSTYLLDFSYNLNQESINSVFFVNFNEALESSQGTMALTHLGFGFRVYPLGINGERTVFDSTTEGRILRPSPFIGSSLGVSNFSIKRVNDTTGYFNAVGFDISLHTGVEVVLTSDIFFVGQVALIQGLKTQNPTTQVSLSYSGIAVLLGLKVTSF